MKWPTSNLGAICKFLYGNSLPQQVRETGNVAVYGSNGIVGEHNVAITKNRTIIIGRKGSVGQVNWSDKGCYPIDTTYYIDEDSTGQNLRWLYWNLKSLRLSELNKAAAVPGLNREDAYRLQIVVPPLDEQKRIAELLDASSSVVRLRENTISRLEELAQSLFVEMFGNPINNDKNINTARVKNLAKLINGRAFKPAEWRDEGMPIIRIQNLNDESKPFNYTDQIIDEKYLIRRGDILFSWSGTPGTSFGCFKWAREDGWLNQHIFKVELNRDLMLPDFFIMQMNLKIGELISQAHGGVGLQHVTKGMVEDLLLVTPSLAQQAEYCKRLNEITSIKKNAISALNQARNLVLSLQHQSFAVN